MKFIVAYDETEGARKAANAAIPLAEASSASLVLLHALNPRTDLAEITGSRDEAIAEATRRAEAEMRAFLGDRAGEVEVRVAIVDRSEDTGETISRAASEEGADLIFIATRRSGGLSGFFLGSVAQQVMHTASMPVAVVRAGKR